MIWLKYFVISLIIFFSFIGFALFLIIYNLNKNQKRKIANQPKKYTQIVIGVALLILLILISIFIAILTINE